MRKKDKWSVLTLSIVIIIIMGLLWWESQVDIAQCDGFGQKVFSSRDTLLIPERHMGYINYDRFVALVRGVDPQIKISERNDSVLFQTVNLHYYLGQNYKPWTSKYKNLPIRIDRDTICVKSVVSDSVKYIYLPYQILSNVAERSPQKNFANIEVDTVPNEYQDKRSNIPTPASIRGEKIQTEGIVRQNVEDILSNFPDHSQYEQLEHLWKYARNHWNYINDPYSETDTWRPASVTINDYYFVNGKCYSGDCDDFAILMASFARQLGYRSHFVAAVNGRGEGHAYAEFLNDGKWTPMDWFSDNFGGTPFQGTIVGVFE